MWSSFNVCITERSVNISGGFFSDLTLWKRPCAPKIFGITKINPSLKQHTADRQHRLQDASDSDWDPCPAYYKSNWSAVISQGFLSSPQNKHILGTCCRAPCLFLHSARLAVSLGKVNHMFELFPRFLSAPLLLRSCATVRAVVYTWKGFPVYFSRISIAHYALALGPESNKFIVALPCLETWYCIELCAAFMVGVKC